MIKDLIMDDYDDMWLGVGNSMHPFNQEPEEEEIFESDVLQDCLDYARFEHDLEPLESAIQNQETIIEKSVDLIAFCQDISGDNVLIKNILQEIKNLLKSNQKK